jgi:hypothetical protein
MVTDLGVRHLWDITPVRSKSKGKGKAKVDDRLFDKAWNEELAKLKAKKVAIQAMIDQMMEG